MRKDLVYNTTLKTYDTLLELASMNGYEIYTIEGTLLDSFMIEGNSTIQVNNAQPREYIIVESIAKNIWESDIIVTCTDNEELARKFYEEWEEYQDQLEESI